MNQYIFALIDINTNKSNMMLISQAHQAMLAISSFLVNLLSIAGNVFHKGL